MLYVIYNTKTWRTLKSPSSYGETYTSERAAKAYRTRMINKNVIVAEDWVIDTKENYRAKEPMVDTYNMLDPERKVIKIRASDKGGCCDPATETYHCM